MFTHLHSSSKLGEKKKREEIKYLEIFSEQCLVESLDFPSYDKQEKNFALPATAQRPCRTQVWKVKCN